MHIRGHYEAKVLRVIDGDTILVSMTCPHCQITSPQRIRLKRIDAPENTERDRSRWADAKLCLTKLLDQKTVIITNNTKWPDKYGRILAEVVLDGINISNVLLERGKAVHYVPASKKQFVTEATDNSLDHTQTPWGGTLTGESPCR